MQRGRLKNIINKSKIVSNKQEVGNSFDEFKKSLPIEVDDNYRLEAAWKAYGSPRNYNEALWEGLIQPVGEDDYKLPSIGYNEETDEYEYLNKGEDNETVAKDIRVWDNNVIPLVQELKLGGYVRTFNKEKDCWIYTKNSQKENTLDQNQVNIQKESSGDLKQEEVEAFKQGGQMNVIPEVFKQGGAVIPSGSLHAHKNHMQLASEGLITPKGIPVISEENGEIQQQAEIEREEVIFDKQATTDIEKLYKKFNETDKESEKNEIAIKAGKILTDIFINNTEDNTGLIEKVADKNNLEYNK